LINAAGSPLDCTYHTLVLDLPLLMLINQPFLSALTASAFGLAVTGSIDYGWSCFDKRF
jgi:hypothetical protein